MNISFKPLQKHHLPLLLKWLETPHVKAWWDQDISWTPELIEKRYGHYILGYKRLILKDRIIEKPMHAYIIECDGIDIGYIQYYNKHDFPPEQGYETTNIPDSCAAFDMYIGDVAYLGRGIGAEALQLFSDEYILKEFDSCFTDPDASNIGAIKAYTKAGFTEVNRVCDVVLMIKSKGNIL